MAGSCSMHQNSCCLLNELTQQPKSGTSLREGLLDCGEQFSETGVFLNQTGKDQACGRLCGEGCPFLESDDRKPHLAGLLPAAAFGASSVQQLVRFLRSWKSLAQFTPVGKKVRETFKSLFQRPDSGLRSSAQMTGEEADRLVEQQAKVPASGEGDVGKRALFGAQIAPFHS